MRVTVAIPVRNGGALLRDVLDAVAGQVLPDGVTCELVVADSASTDGSAAAARERGAEVIAIDPATFSHGGTRNVLMERSQGEVVAFLTQDAVPAGPDWLASLLHGFELADDVALVFGPYLPRPDASPMVTRELQGWFRALAPDGRPRIDRLGPDERDVPARALYGPRGFFTDANGAVRRAAWSQAPFRPVPYAEDHVLALDMLRAGFAKAFVPEAAVVHSHDYGAVEWLRRSFDEARAISAVYGVDDLGDARRLARHVRGAVRGDLRHAGGMQAAGATAPSLPGLVVTSLTHHGARALGTALGARAAHLPPALTRRLSLERRA